MHDQAPPDRIPREGCDAVYVTRFESRENDSGGVRSLGEFPTYQQAYDVGYALAKSEHEQRGWEPGDGRMRYPEMLPAGPLERVPVPPYEVTR